MSLSSTPMLPVASPRVLFLLYSILLCAAIDLSLSLINLGLTSFFVAPISSIAAIIHVLTNLFIILHRLRQQRTHLPLNNSKSINHGSQWQPSSSSNWELLPPTSKLSSITMDVLLGTMFIAAFVTSLLVNILNYFGGGGNNTEGSDDGDGIGIGTGTSPIRGPAAVLYTDVGLELLCGILLLALSVIASFERRWFQEVPKKLPLGDGEEYR